MFIKSDRPTPSEVYESIQDNTETNEYFFSSPPLVTSTICDDEEEYPKNQSQTCAEQKTMYHVLWFIMQKSRHCFKKPAYDHPGHGIGGCYVCTRALSICHCDTNKTVQNDCPHFWESGLTLTWDKFLLSLWVSFHYFRWSSCWLLYQSSSSSFSITCPQTTHHHWICL